MSAATASATAAASINISGKLTGSNITVSATAKNQISITGAADAALRTISVDFEATAGVTIAGTAELRGTSIDISARTLTDVVVNLTNLHLPNFLAAVDVDLVGGDGESKLDKILDGSFGSGDVLALLAGDATFNTSRVSSTISVANSAQVIIDAAAKLIQAGGTANDETADVKIAATDVTNVGVTLTTGTPGLISSLANVAVFGALSSTIDLDRRQKC